jgi:hypothetical protein
MPCGGSLRQRSTRGSALRRDNDRYRESSRTGQGHFYPFASAVAEWPVRGAVSGSGRPTPATRGKTQISRERSISRACFFPATHLAAERVDARVCFVPQRFLFRQIHPAQESAVPGVGLELLKQDASFYEVQAGVLPLLSTLEPLQCLIALTAIRVGLRDAGGVIV